MKYSTTPLKGYTGKMYSVLVPQGSLPVRIIITTTSTSSRLEESASNRIKNGHRLGSNNPVIVEKMLIKSSRNLVKQNRTWLIT